MGRRKGRTILVRGEPVDLTDTDLKRFTSLVDRSGSCWLWLGKLDTSGYGKYRVYAGGRRPSLIAHRVAFQIWGTEPVQPGLEIDHLCRNKLCCQPQHMEQVTAEENTRRIPRSPLCAQGHVLIPSPYSSGPRTICRVCRADASRRYRQRVA